ncbi:MAG: SDR family oxidoreductase [Microthrixaceae bacterium]
MASVLITGASSGIGAACVRRLDALGHEVFAGVRRSTDAERLTAERSERVVPVILDVTDEGSIAGVAEVVAERRNGRGLDGLVNNAGIAVSGPVEFLPLERWREQFEVNVLGQVAMVKAFTQQVRAARGRIVFVGSMAGRIATPFGAPYGSSKHAVAGVVESLREELRPWHIRVSLVEPGAVATPIWTRGIGAYDRLAELIGPRGVELYGERLRALEEQVAEIPGRAPTPARAVSAIEHALFAPRPRLRYAAGADARVVAALLRALPDTAMAAIVRRTGP